MYPTYSDIRSRLGFPKWFDQNGVPRYSEFSPNEAAEIYYNWVALLEVKCQACGRIFLCATALDEWNLYHGPDVPIDINEEEILNHLLGWGDAPWHGYQSDINGENSQCAGTTMSTDFRVKEIWRKEGNVWESVSVPEDFKNFED